jgi:hypothetical protein
MLKGDRYHCHLVKNSRLPKIVQNLYNFSHLITKWQWYWYLVSSRYHCPKGRYYLPAFIAPDYIAKFEMKVKTCAN